MKTINIISKWVLIGTIVLLIFCLMGCAKHTDPIENIANTAHQQIVAIRESLPPECQTKAIDEQLKAHDGTVDSIVQMCDEQKAKIEAEKVRWKWAFMALALIIAIHVGRKVIK